LPQEVLEAWLREREETFKTAEQMGRPLSQSEEKRLHHLHSEKVEKYLDAGHGECWMKEERIARVVADALKHFDGERYDLAAWCVMPNHVHVVVKPRAGHDLPDILHSWKSFTAHSANKLLRRTRQFWQEEYYDHLIRDEDDFGHCVEYVLSNPAQAGLKDWKWSGSTVARASRP
jgi:REP element-mobilizing transposase RayT